MSSYKSSKILLSVLVVQLIKSAVLQIIMVAAETDFLVVERPCLDSQVILYVYGSLDQDHSLIIEVIGNNFAVLTLILKSGILGFLLDLGFVDELFQITDLFAQVFIYVAAL